MRIYKVKNDVFVDAKWAKLNKQEFLADYKKQVKKGHCSKEEAKICAIAVMSNDEFLKFSNTLMNGRDWLQPYGGTSCHAELPDVAWWELTKDQQDLFRKTAYLITVAILNEDTKESFLVDTQGYSYARYVGILCGNIKGLENSLYKASAGGYKRA